MFMLGQSASGKFVDTSSKFASGDFFESDRDWLEKKPAALEAHQEILWIEFRVVSGVILYSYCHNDPINKVDVLGLKEVDHDFWHTRKWVIDRTDPFTRDDEGVIWVNMVAFQEHWLGGGFHQRNIKSQKHQKAHNLHLYQWTENASGKWIRTSNGENSDKLVTAIADQTHKPAKLGITVLGGGIAVFTGVAVYPVLAEVGTATYVYAGHHTGATYLAAEAGQTVLEISTNVDMPSLPGPGDVVKFGLRGSTSLVENASKSIPSLTNPRVSVYSGKLAARSLEAGLNGTLKGDDLFIDMYQAHVTRGNYGTSIISEAIKQAGRPIKSITGNLGGVNWTVYEATNDIWKTPIGKSMKQLGYDKFVLRGREFNFY